MAFSPEEIANKEFLPALRGYDKEEVRAFLAAVAGDYRDALKSNVRGAPSSGQSFESLGQEVAAVLQASKDSADKMIEESERKVAALHDRAIAEAQRIRNESNEAARRIREEATAYAAQAKDGADRNAAKLLRDTKKRVELLRSTESRLRQRLMSMEALIQSMRQELAEEDGEDGDPVIDLAAEEQAENEQPLQEEGSAEGGPVDEAAGATEDESAKESSPASSSTGRRARPKRKKAGAAR